MQLLEEILGTLLSLSADSVQLRPGYPPHFIANGDPIKTSGNAVTNGQVIQIRDQILRNDEKRTLITQGRISGEYHSNQTGQFAFVLKKIDTGLAVAFRSLSETQNEQLKGDDNGLESSVTEQFGDLSLTGILKTVVERQISDLVISTGRPARVRIGGQYHQLPNAIFSHADIFAVLDQVLTPDRKQSFERSGSIDLAYEIEAAGQVTRRFRVNLFQHSDGIASAWRPIWDVIPSLNQLRLPPQVLELADIPYGLVLITGPTGSGKSTTLSALVEHINQTYKRHIITLEDPIEYRFRDRASVIHQREVGIHVDSFSNGLRSALREAPDVILVGEMRDQDTIAAALTAAETGHLVLSTLHSGHSAQAIDRVIDVFPEHQQQQVRVQLSDVLRAVVTQRLLPTLDKQSRVPAVELVRVNYAVSNTIREGRMHQLMSLIQSGSKNGMLPFDSSLAGLVREGLIDMSVATSCARDKSFFESLVRRKV